MDHQKKQQMNVKGTEKNYPATKDQENELIDQDVDEDEDEEEESMEKQGVQGNRQNKQNRDFGQEGQDKKQQNPKNQGQQQHPDDVRKREDIFQQRDKKDQPWKVK